MTLPRTSRPALLFCALAAASCSRAPTSTAPAPPAPPPAAESGVVAKVNGRAITTADIEHRRSAEAGGAHGGGAAADRVEVVLDSIIGQELLAQRAVALGLDGDAAYREELRKMEAQLAAWKRKRLGDLVFEREVAGKTEVTEADARRYYDDNAARIRTTIHVLQIFRRDRAAIEAAERALKSGAPFEEVAKGAIPDAPPAGAPPWDLGWLQWIQLPEAWRDEVIDMKPGDVSGVLAGPNQRYWIVKVVEKREDPAITFERIKPMLVEALRGSRTASRRAELERELRARAKIEYLR